MDENKHPNNPQGKEAQKGNATTPNGREVPKTANRRMFSKRWMYPALYLGAAALIVGLMYIKSQSGGSSPVITTNGVTDNGGSTTSAPAFAWPAAKDANAKVTMGYFNAQGSAQDQAAALVSYDNGFYPHAGYDIQAANKQSFDVTAAIDGKVTAVTNNQVYGLTIEVTTPSGYVVHYESLSAAKVSVNDQVKQGQVIGTSGTCAFEKSQGNHLYFEVLKNGVPVDPGTLLPKA